MQPLHDVLTPPSHAALGAVPAGGASGAGALAHTTHMVGGWAGIAAEQRAAHAAQHAHIGVGVTQLELGGLPGVGVEERHGS